MPDLDNRLVEALIFAAPEPIDEKRLLEVIGSSTPEQIQSAIHELNVEYERDNRAFRIVRGGGGYRFATLPEYGRWVKSLVIGPGRVRLSRAALETLSVIAYRQPISRPDIESIRGVDVGGVLRMLLDRKLVTVKGRAKTAGRPLLYGTTTEFLKHFGIDSLDDLPQPGELVEKILEDMNGETEQDSNELFESPETEVKTTNQP